MKLGKSSYYFQIGLLVTVLVFLGALTWPKAEAQSESTAVEGYAWSENIGWIHFNHNKANPVTVSPSGDLAGYAWSDNIGWISLNRTDTGAPPSGDVGGGVLAKVDGTSVKGWARAFSAVNRNDGWDGWIQFDHNKANPVTVDSSGRVDGYAWGSDVIGWIDMSPNGSEPQGCEVTGTCPDNPECDPAVHVCGPGNGGGLSVSCEMLATGSVGTPVPFTVVTNQVVDPQTYGWEWTNGDDTTVDGSAVTVGSASGDNDVMVTFNQEGTYRGEVTVISGNETVSATCSHDAGDTIVIGEVENPDLFRVDDSSCTIHSGTRCVLKIDRDTSDSVYSENYIKLLNLTEGAAQINWSSEVRSGLAIEFCADTDDATNDCVQDRASMSGNVFIRARLLNENINDRDYVFAVIATQGENSTEKEMVIKYINSGVGQGSKNVE